MKNIFFVFIFFPLLLSGQYQVNSSGNLLVDGAGNVLKYSSIPSASDAIFWLDGTIVSLSGNYYFKDYSGHGRNFLITGYDFSPIWGKGFPFKSAATISAPAGDAILIAADIDNFLYTSGTPNQIPVISFFQNVDYKNKLFCRYLSQVVDANDVETFQGRIVDIVLYATVKTGADLITCNTYYVVPTIDATAKWIDPVNGSDGGGSGTQANPYRSFTKLETLTPTGTKMCYILSGDTTYVATGYLLMQKGWNYVATGRLSITASKVGGGTYAVRRITNPGTFSNFIISTGTTMTSTIDNGKGVMMQHCYLSPGNHTQMTLSSTDSLNPYNFFGNIYKSSGTSTIAINFLRTTFPTCTIKDNYMSPTLVNPFLSNYNGYYKGTLTISNNKLIKNVTGSVNIIYINNQANYDVKMYGNNIQNIHSTSTGTLSYFENTNSINIHHNYFYSRYQSTPIAIDPSTFTITATSIASNKLIYYSKYGIKIGLDSYTSGHELKMTSPVIEKNYLIQVQGFSTVGHVIFIGYQTGGLLRYNKIESPDIGLIVEGNNYNNKGGVFYGNLITGCKTWVVVAGADSTVVSNNTMVTDSINTQGVRIIENTGSYKTKGVVFKNNVLVCNSGSKCMVNIDTSCSRLGVFIDYNIYYCGNGGTPYFSISSVNKTIAQWQAMGYDTHSIFLTPTEYAGLFTDPANGDYSLKAGSVAIGSGTTLDSSFDDGLDASTVWGDDTSYPVVVTKQQGASWDIGAYVH